MVYAFFKSPSDAWLLAALILTLVADTFLLGATHRSHAEVYQTTGIAVFALAQIMHLTRLLTALRHRNALALYLPMVLLVMAIGTFCDQSLLHIIAPIYATTLLLNLVLAMHYRSLHRNSQAANNARLGFMLFVACDFCVALEFLTRSGSITLSILPLISYLVWLFYYPSQVFLAHSSLKKPDNDVI